LRLHQKPVARRSVQLAATAVAAAAPPRLLGPPGNCRSGLQQLADSGLRPPRLCPCLPPVRLFHLPRLVRCVAQTLSGLLARIQRLVANSTTTGCPSGAKT